jgi:hypothetical protein
MIGLAWLGCLMACTGRMDVLEEAPPALVLDNRSGAAVVITGWQCGQDDAARPLHSGAIPSGQTRRMPLPEGCWSFDAHAGDRLVGRQHNVALRREMDWVLGR